MLEAHLGKPLTRVPDPFANEYPSFGAHNNARLRAFLDTFGFDYEFASSTDYYTSGRFDAALLRMLERLDKVMEIMLPTLARGARARPIRRSCRSARAPAWCCRCRSIAHDAKAGTISYDDPETEGARHAFPSPAAIASCNGSRTGRCAGSRSASTMKWPART